MPFQNNRQTLAQPVPCRNMQFKIVSAMLQTKQSPPEWQNDHQQHEQPTGQASAKG